MVAQRTKKRARAPVEVGSGSSAVAARWAAGGGRPGIVMHDPKPCSTATHARTPRTVCEGRRGCVAGKRPRTRFRRCCWALAPKKARSFRLVFCCVSAHTGRTCTHTQTRSRSGLSVMEVEGKGGRREDDDETSRGGLWVTMFVCGQRTRCWEETRAAADGSRFGSRWTL
jgi:hypothetical protein